MNSTEKPNNSLGKIDKFVFPKKNSDTKKLTYRHKFISLSSKEVIMTQEIKWSLVNKKISELKPHPTNPRSLTKQQYGQLEKSLQRFGLVEKPIINLDGTIIGGHQRISVLKKKKQQFVECWIPERILEEKDLNDLNLILNRVHGDFDYEILANHYELSDLLECGFNPEELHMDLEDTSSDSEEKEEPPKCEKCGQKIKK